MKVRQITIDSYHLEKFLHEIGWNNILQIEHIYNRIWFTIMYVEEKDNENHNPN